MSVTLRCYVEPLGRTLADGLEAVELYVSPESEPLIQKPPEGQRVEIVFSTRMGSFKGGLRMYMNSGQVYVCPDLRSEPDGRKVSLARVLKDSGVEPKQHVDVFVHDNVWQLDDDYQERSLD
jgi:hypothetical protein